MLTFKGSDYDEKIYSEEEEKAVDSAMKGMGLEEALTFPDATDYGNVFDRQEEAV